MGLRWLRTLMLAMSVAAAATSVRAGDMYGGPVGPQPYLQPAYRAEEFVDFMAINADPFSRYLTDGPFKGAGTKYPPEVFFDLGIRYYRQALKYDLTPPDIVQKVTAAYDKYGVRPMVLIDPHKDGSPEEVVALLKQYPPGVIAEVEGPNELNNKFPPQELNMKYKGKTDEAAGSAYMDDYYKAIKSDPATKDIPVVAFTAIFTDYRLAKPHTSFDYSNMHSYQGYETPSTSLEMNFTRFNNILPVGGIIKPFVPTECGYNVEEDVANHTGITGSLAAQARNIPMLYAEYFRHGIKRAYLFAANNADGYGLLESDQETRRPSYYAVKNLVAALKDATWNSATKKWEGGDFTPKALLFDIAGAPESVHTLVLQKKSGEYLLLIWNEIVNYDSGAKKELNNPAVPVTLMLKTPVKPEATILTQNASGAYDTTSVRVSAGKLQLQVPSSVMIVRLTPASNAVAKTLAAPAGVSGEATESEAHLHWQAVPGASGYFVFRNGWQIATTTGTSAVDRSSWLRPGLGYTYAVQAYDAAGNQSARSEAIVQTAARFPDLMVTSFGPEKQTIQPGEQIRFTAKLKNIGAGMTPPGVQNSVTWTVDGKTVGWGGGPGPMKPGEERTVVSMGGPGTGGLWTATPGTHLLKCAIDDINRLPGEPKENNLYDATFVVGTQGRGMLMGSTQAAPGQVDLTREGTLDWIHWGLNGKDIVTRKAAGGKLFGELTKTGEGYLDTTAGCPVGIKWSDGDTTNEMADTHFGLWWNSVGTGRSFTVPADSTPRLLRVYVAGIEGAGATLTARLSDGSAPEYVSDTWSGNAGNGNWAPVPGGFAAVYTIKYRAAAPGQKLIVEWKLTSEPNRFLGQARLQAATLAPANGQ